jgi:hypothetical protein
VDDIKKVELISCEGDEEEEINFKVRDNKINIGDLPIGRYKLCINGYTKFKKEGKINEKYIYVIYNALSPKDDSYISVDLIDKFPADKRMMKESKIKTNTQLVDEYLLQPTSYIYKGKKNKYSLMEWSYDQEHFLILDVLMTLIDRAIPIRERGEIAWIARVMSNLGNFCGRDLLGGILVGCWDSERLCKLHPGEFAPGDWKGSLQIFKEFVKRKYKPVQFGQCWVFAGMLTTMMRVLGIPARTITNFGSAHDTNGDMIIERKSVRGDSVWNFHCWVEAWFKRDDIEDKKYAGHGWQAIDATPQEQSEDAYQMGPCPLLAIRNDELEIDYDARFLRTCVKYKTDPLDSDYIVTKVMCECGDNAFNITSNYV